MLIKDYEGSSSSLSTSLLATFTLSFLQILKNLSQNFVTYSSNLPFSFMLKVRPLTRDSLVTFERSDILGSCFYKGETATPNGLLSALELKPGDISSLVLVFISPKVLFREFTADFRELISFFKLRFSVFKFPLSASQLQICCTILVKVPERPSSS